MANTILELLDNKPAPVNVRLDETAVSAFRSMLEYDFSQLPVVDHDGHPSGMITPTSVLRALTYLGVPLDQLRVEEARVPATTLRHDQDLTKLLDALESAPAVLVIDDDNKLIGIVTPYDTSEFFRRRAHDIMALEDIENTIRDYIVAAFTDGDGKTDWHAVNAAIEDITPSGGENLKRFRAALASYMRKEHPTSQINGESLTNSFSEHFKTKTPAFEDLHLSEFIDLLTHKDRWATYQDILRISREAMLGHLHSIRKTRNAVAHFRTDVDAVRRDELDFCLSLLQRNQQNVREAFRQQAAARAEPKPMSVVAPVAPATVDEEESLRPTEVSSQGRYAPLARWLEQRPDDVNQVELTFAQLEKIIGAELPPTARQHRSWWANDSVGHSQSKEWLSVDWRVSEVSFTSEQVSFARIEERQRAYIDFFTPLLDELKKAASWSVRNNSPAGRSWHTVATIRRAGAVLGYLVFSFTRTQQFRVELYIDTKNKEKNKRIFDYLHSKRESIEQSLEQRLSWERLPERAASRVAAYRDVSIGDSEDVLLRLRAWAIDKMLRLRTAVDATLNAFSDMAVVAATSG